MTTTRRANSGGSADAINLSSGTIRELLAVGLVGADGALIGNGGTLTVATIGSLKAVFLGTSGGVADVDTSGSVTNTANNTTARYAQVPAGKVWRIWAITAIIYDASATIGTLLTHFAAQTPPSAGNGLRIRTVDTDTTTEIATLAASAEVNIQLMAALELPLTSFAPATTNNVLMGTWRLPVPIVLTAGQRFEVKHLSAVAYTLGAWRIQYAESDA